MKANTNFKNIFNRNGYCHFENLFSKNNLENVEKNLSICKFIFKKIDSKLFKPKIVDFKDFNKFCINLKNIIKIIFLISHH